MTAMQQFSPAYGPLALGVFAIEAAIAGFLTGGFIRHTLGDTLVVVLLYAALLSVARIDRRLAAAGVFAFAVIVEATQAADLAARLGLTGTAFGRLVLGSTFSWADIAAYGAGAIGVLIADESLRAARNRASGRR